MYHVTFLVKLVMSFVLATSLDTGAALGVQEARRAGGSTYMINKVPTRYCVCSGSETGRGGVGLQGAPRARRRTESDSREGAPRKRGDPTVI